MIQTGRTLHNSTDLPGSLIEGCTGEWRCKRESGQKSEHSTLEAVRCCRGRTARERKTVG